MSTTPDDTFTTDPIRLVTALQTAGCELVSLRPGCRARLTWPVDTGRSLVVSLDPTAPEHEQMMEALYLELTTAVNLGRLAAGVLATLTPIPTTRGEGT